VNLNGSTPIWSAGKAYPPDEDERGTALGLRAAVQPTPGQIVAQYLPLIQTYFPAEQVGTAGCILGEEVTLALTNCLSPESCVTPLPTAVQCYSDQSPGPASAYGLYQIIDQCWNPALAGGQTPFTDAEWAAVLDPNTNIWMASVIWSIGGWRSWTTCDACQWACLTPGGPIPYPRGPVTNPVYPPTNYVATPLYYAVSAAAVAAALWGLAGLERRGF
jgi:hypothetical protein